MRRVRGTDCTMTVDADADRSPHPVTLAARGPPGAVTLSLTEKEAERLTSALMDAIRYLRRARAASPVGSGSGG
jgi:mRNA-degrading endonuclease toxin of MazEF toxin-antitoxin module